ncbi:MAG: hypothetical protein KC897_02405, partial [Candidatus Omnitrophica bacterium]|nr:hypothetical protein [Candidatus Omnitrophota bacterium]
MNEKPDNFEPEESGNPSPQGEDFRLSPDLVNPDSQANTVPGKTLELNFAEDDDVGVHPGQIDLGPYVESDRKAPTFRSRFHSWMKAVSLAIILVFVPEQASWAFNYNPLVLWGEKSAYPSQSAAQPHGAEFNELVSEHIAGSVYKLLGDVAYKDNARVKLQLPAGGANPDQDVSLNVNIKGENPFNLEYINQVVSWLRQPEIHPLNCGVYALRDILNAYEIDVELEEISVSSLAVDLMSHIVKPGEPKLKTSLYSISKIVDAYGLGFRNARLSPQDVTKIDPPFIASFNNEHFVTVTAIQDGVVYYNDIGRPSQLSEASFVSQLSGFVLARNLNQHQNLEVEYIPDSMAAFVWGDKWRDQSDDLPGMYGFWDEFGGIIIGLALAGIGYGLGQLAEMYKTVDMLAKLAQLFGSLGQMLGGGMAAFAVSFVFSYGLSQFASSVATVCYMKGACSEEGAMLLNIGISVGGNLWAGGVIEAANAGVTAASGATLGTMMMAGLKQAMVNLPSALAYSLVKRFVMVKVAEFLIEELDLANEDGEVNPLTQSLVNIVGGAVGGIIGSAASAGVQWVGGKIVGDSGNHSGSVTRDSDGKVNGYTPNYSIYTNAQASGFFMDFMKQALTNELGGAFNQLVGLAGRYLLDIVGVDPDSVLSQVFGQMMSSLMAVSMEASAAADLEEHRDEIEEELTNILVEEGHLKRNGDTLEVVSDKKPTQAQMDDYTQRAMNKVRGGIGFLSRLSGALSQMGGGFMNLFNSGRTNNSGTPGAPPVDPTTLVGTAPGSEAGEGEGEGKLDLTAAVNLALSQQGAAVSLSDLQFNRTFNKMTQEMMTEVSGMIVRGLISVVAALVMDLIENEFVDGEREGVNQTDRFTLFITRLITFGVMTGITAAVAISTSADVVTPDGKAATAAAEESGGNKDNFLNADTDNTITRNGMSKSDQLWFFALEPFANLFFGMVRSMATANGTSPLFFSFEEIGNGGQALTEEQKNNPALVNYLWAKGADASGAEVANMAGPWGDINRVLAIKRSREGSEQAMAEERARAKAEHPSRSDEELDLYYGGEQAWNRTLTGLWNLIDQNRYSGTYVLDMMNNHLLGAMTNLTANPFINMVEFLAPALGSGATAWMAAHGLQPKQLIYQHGMSGQFELGVRGMSSRLVLGDGEDPVRIFSEFYVQTGMADFFYDLDDLTDAEVNRLIKVTFGEDSQLTRADLEKDKNLEWEVQQTYIGLVMRANGANPEDQGAILRMASRSWVLGTAVEPEDIMFSQVLTDAGVNNYYSKDESTGALNFFRLPGGADGGNLEVYDQNYPTYVNSNYWKQSELVAYNMNNPGGEVQTESGWQKIADSEDHNARNIPGNENVRANGMAAALNAIAALIAEGQITMTQGEALMAALRSGDEAAWNSNQGAKVLARMGAGTPATRDRAVQVERPNGDGGVPPEGTRLIQGPNGITFFVDDAGNLIFANAGADGAGVAAVNEGPVTLPLPADAPQGVATLTKDGNVVIKDETTGEVLGSYTLAQLFPGLSTSGGASPAATSSGGGEALSFAAVFKNIENARLTGFFTDTTPLAEGETAEGRDRAFASYWINERFGGNLQMRMRYGSIVEAGLNDGYFDRVVEFSVREGQLVAFQSRNLMALTPFAVHYSGFRFGAAQNRDEAGNLKDGYARYFFVFEQAIGNDGQGGLDKGDAVEIFRLGLTAGVEGDFETALKDVPEENNPATGRTKGTIPTRTISQVAYSEYGNPLFFSEADRSSAAAGLLGRMRGLANAMTTRQGVANAPGLIQQLFAAIDSHREATTGYRSISRTARNEALAAALSYDGTVGFRFEHHTGSVINPITFETVDKEGPLTMAMIGSKSNGTSQFQLAFGGTNMTLDNNGLRAGNGALVLINTVGAYNIRNIVNGGWLSGNLNDGLQYASFLAFYNGRVATLTGFNPGSNFNNGTEGWLDGALLQELHNLYGRDMSGALTGAPLSVNSRQLFRWIDAGDDDRINGILSLQHMARILFLTMSERPEGLNLPGITADMLAELFIASSKEGFDLATYIARPDTLNLPTDANTLAKVQAAIAFISSGDYQVNGAGSLFQVAVPEGQEARDVKAATEENLNNLMARVMAGVVEAVRSDDNLAHHPNLSNALSGPDPYLALLASGGAAPAAEGETEDARLLRENVQGRAGAGYVGAAPVNITAAEGDSAMWGQRYTAAGTGTYHYDSEGRLQFLANLVGKYVQWDPASQTATLFNSDGPAVNLIVDPEMRKYVYETGIRAGINRLRARGQNAAAAALEAVLQQTLAGTNGVITANAMEAFLTGTGNGTLSQFLSGSEEKDALMETMGRAMVVAADRVDSGVGIPEGAVETFNRQIVLTERGVYTADSILVFDSMQAVPGMPGLRVQNLIIRNQRGQAPEFFAFGLTPRFEYKGPASALAQALLAASGQLQMVRFDGEVTITGMIRNSLLGSSAGAMPLISVLTGDINATIKDGATGSLARFDGTTLTGDLSMRDKFTFRNVEFSTDRDDGTFRIRLSGPEGYEDVRGESDVEANGPDMGLGRALNPNYTAVNPTPLGFGVESSEQPDTTGNLAGLIDNAVFVDRSALSNLYGFFDGGGAVATAGLTEETRNATLYYVREGGTYQAIVPAPVTEATPDGYIAAGSPMRGMVTDLTARGSSIALVGGVWELITQGRATLASDNLRVVVRNGVIADEHAGRGYDSGWLYLDGVRGSIARFMQFGEFDIVGGRVVVRTGQTNVDDPITLNNRGKVVIPTQGLAEGTDIRGLVAGGRAVQLPEDMIELTGEYGLVDPALGLGQALVTYADAIAVTYNQIREDRFGSRILMRRQTGVDEESGAPEFEYKMVDGEEARQLRDAGGARAWSEYTPRSNEAVIMQGNTYSLVSTAEATRLVNAQQAQLVGVSDLRRQFLLRNKDGEVERTITLRDLIFGEWREDAETGEVSLVEGRGAVKAGLETVRYGFEGLSRENRLQITYGQNGISRISVPEGAEQQIMARPEGQRMLNWSGFRSGITNYSFGRRDGDNMTFLFAPFVGFAREPNNIQPVMVAAGPPTPQGAMARDDLADAIGVVENFIAQQGGPPASEQFVREYAAALVDLYNGPNAEDADLRASMLLGMVMDGSYADPAAVMAQFGPAYIGPAEGTMIPLTRDGVAVTEDKGGSLARSVLYLAGGDGIVDVTNAVSINNDAPPPPSDGATALSDREREIRADTRSSFMVRGVGPLDENGVTDDGWVVAEGLQGDVPFLNRLRTGDFSSGTITPFGPAALNQTITEEARTGLQGDSRIVFSMGSGAPGPDGDIFTGNLTLNYTNANIVMDPATELNALRAPYAFIMQTDPDAPRLADPFYEGQGATPQLLALTENEGGLASLVPDDNSRAQIVNWQGAQLMRGRIFKATGADDLAGYIVRDGTVRFFGANALFFAGTGFERGVYEGLDSNAAGDGTGERANQRIYHELFEKTAGLYRLGASGEWEFTNYTDPDWLRTQGLSEPIQIVGLREVSGVSSPRTEGRWIATNLIPSSQRGFDVDGDGEISIREGQAPKFFYRERLQGGFALDGETLAQQFGSRWRFLSDGSVDVVLTDGAPYPLQVTSTTYNNISDAQRHPDMVLRVILDQGFNRGGLKDEQLRSDIEHRFNLLVAGTSRRERRDDDWKSPLRRQAIEETIMSDDTPLSALGIDREALEQERGRPLTAGEVTALRREKVAAFFNQVQPGAGDTLAAGEGTPAEGETPQAGPLEFLGRRDASGRIRVEGQYADRELHGPETLVIAGKYDPETNTGENRLYALLDDDVVGRESSLHLRRGTFNRSRGRAFFELVDNPAITDIRLANQGVYDHRATVPQVVVAADGSVSYRFPMVRRGMDLPPGFDYAGRLAEFEAEVDRYAGRYSNRPNADAIEARFARMISNRWLREINNNENFTYGIEYDDIMGMAGEFGVGQGGMTGRQLSAWITQILIHRQDPTEGGMQGLGGQLLSNGFVYLPADGFAAGSRLEKQSFVNTLEDLRNWGLISISDRDMRAIRNGDALSRRETDFDFNVNSPFAEHRETLPEGRAGTNFAAEQQARLDAGGATAAEMGMARMGLLEAMQFAIASGLTTREELSAGLLERANRGDQAAADLLALFTDGLQGEEFRGAMEGARSAEVIRVYTERFQHDDFRAVWGFNDKGQFGALQVRDFNRSEGWFDWIGNEDFTTSGLTGQAGGQTGEIDTDEAVYVSRNEWQDLTTLGDAGGREPPEKTFEEAYQENRGGTLAELRAIESFGPLRYAGQGWGMEDDDTGTIFYGEDGKLRTGWINRSNDQEAMMRNIGGENALRFAGQLDSMGTVATIMGALVILDVVITVVEVVAIIATGGLGTPVVAGAGEGAKQGIKAGVRYGVRYGARQAVMGTMRKYGVHAALEVATRLAAHTAATRGTRLLAGIAARGLAPISRRLMAPGVVGAFMRGASASYTTRRLIQYGLLGGSINAALGSYARGEVSMETLTDFAHGAFLFGLLSRQAPAKAAGSVLQRGLTGTMMAGAERASQAISRTKFAGLDKLAATRVGGFLTSPGVLLAGGVFGGSVAALQLGSRMRGNEAPGLYESLAIGGLATAAILGGGRLAAAQFGGAYAGAKQFGQTIASIGLLGLGVGTLVHGTDMSLEERTAQLTGDNLGFMYRTRRALTGGLQTASYMTIVAGGMRGLGYAATAELKTGSRVAISMLTGAGFGGAMRANYLAWNSDSDTELLWDNALLDIGTYAAGGGLLLGPTALLAMRAGASSPHAIREQMARNALKQAGREVAQTATLDSRAIEMALRTKTPQQLARLERAARWELASPRTFGELSMRGKVLNAVGFAGVGGAGKVGYEYLVNASPQNPYSVGQGVADFIGGAGLAMLALFAIRGAKNLSLLRNFSDDAAFQSARLGGAAAKGVEAAAGPRSAAQALFDQSALGAAKWTLVSPAFTIGGALWTGLAARVETMIDGDESRYRKFFGPGRLPAFILKTEGGYINLISGQGLQAVYDSAVTGPLHGLWMAPAFGTFQVLGGNVRPGGGFSTAAGRFLQAVQRGPGESAGKVVSTLYRDVGYMPGLVTMTSTAVDFFSNGSNSLSLSALARLIDNSALGQDLNAWLAGKDVAAIRESNYTEVEVNGETKYEFKYGNAVEGTNRPVVFNHYELEAAGYAAFLGLPQIGMRSAQLRTQAGKAEEAGNYATARQLATEATRIDRYDQEAWGIRLRSERGLALSRGIPLRDVSDSHNELLDVALATGDQAFINDARLQQGIYKSDVNKMAADKYIYYGLREVENAYNATSAAERGQFEAAALQFFARAEGAVDRAMSHNPSNVDALAARAQIAKGGALLRGEYAQPEVQASIIEGFRQARQLAVQEFGAKSDVVSHFDMAIKAEEGRMAEARMKESWRQLGRTEAGAELDSTLVAKGVADAAEMRAKMVDGDYTASTLFVAAEFDRMSHGDRGFLERDATTGNDIGAKRFHAYEGEMSRALELARSANDGKLADVISANLNAVRFQRYTHEGYQAATEPGRDLQLAHRKFGQARKYADAVSAEAAAKAESNFQIIADLLPSEMLAKARLSTSEWGTIHQFEATRVEANAPKQAQDAADAAQSGYEAMLRTMSPEKASVLPDAHFRAWTQIQGKAGSPSARVQGLAQIAKAQHLRGESTQAIDRLITRMESQKGKSPEGTAKEIVRQIDREIDQEIRDVRDFKDNVPPNSERSQPYSGQNGFTEAQLRIMGRYNNAANAFFEMGGKVPVGAEVPVAREFRLAGDEYRPMLEKLTPDLASRLSTDDYRRWLGVASDGKITTGDRSVGADKGGDQTGLQATVSGDLSVDAAVTIAKAAFLRGDTATLELMRGRIETSKTDDAASQRVALESWMKSTKPNQQADLTEAGFEVIDLASAVKTAPESSDLGPVTIRHTPMPSSGHSSTRRSSGSDFSVISQSGDAKDVEFAREGLAGEMNIGRSGMNRKAMQGVALRESGDVTGEGRRQEDLSAILTGVDLRWQSASDGTRFSDMYKGIDFKPIVWGSRPYEAGADAKDFALLVDNVTGLRNELRIAQGNAENSGGYKARIEKDVNQRIDAALDKFLQDRSPNTSRDAIKEFVVEQADQILQQYDRAGTSFRHAGKDFDAHGTPGREAQSEILSLFFTTINEMAMIERNPSLAGNNRIGRIMSAPTGAGKSVALALALDYLTRIKTAGDKTTIVAVPNLSVKNEIMEMARIMGTRVNDVSVGSGGETGKNLSLAKDAVNIALHSEAQQLVLSGRLGKDGSVKNYRLFVDEIDEFIRMNDMREGDSSANDVDILRNSSLPADRRQLRREQSLREDIEIFARIVDSRIKGFERQGEISDPAARVVELLDSGKTRFIDRDGIMAEFKAALAERRGMSNPDAAFRAFERELREISTETNHKRDDAGNIIQEGTPVNFDTLINEIGASVRAGEGRSSYDKGSITKVATVDRGGRQSDTTPEVREQAMANAVTALMRASDNGRLELNSPDAEIAFQLALRQKPASRVARASDVIGQADMFIGFSATAKSVEFYLKNIEGAEIRVVRSENNKEIDSTERSELMLINDDSVRDIVGPDRSVRRQIALIERRILGTSREEVNTKTDLNSDRIWVKLARGSDGKDTVVRAREGEAGAIEINRSPVTGLLIQNLALFEALSKPGTRLREGAGAEKYDVVSAASGSEKAETAAKGKIQRALSTDLVVEILQTHREIAAARESGDSAKVSVLDAKLQRLEAERNIVVVYNGLVTGSNILGANAGVRSLRAQVEAGEFAVKELTEMAKAVSGETTRSGLDSRLNTLLNYVSDADKFGLTKSASSVQGALKEAMDLSRQLGETTDAKEANALGSRIAARLQEASSEVSRELRPMQESYDLTSKINVVSWGAKPTAETSQALGRGDINEDVGSKRARVNKALSVIAIHHEGAIMSDSLIRAAEGILAKGGGEQRDADVMEMFRKIMDEAGFRGEMNQVVQVVRQGTRANVVESEVMELAGKRAEQIKMDRLLNVLNTVNARNTGNRLTTISTLSGSAYEGFAAAVDSGYAQTGKFSDLKRTTITAVQDLPTLGLFANETLDIESGIIQGRAAAPQVKINFEATMADVENKAGAVLDAIEFNENGFARRLANATVTESKVDAMPMAVEDFSDSTLDATQQMAVGRLTQLLPSQVEALAKESGLSTELARELGEQVEALQEFANTNLGTQRISVYSAADRPMSEIQLNQIQKNLQANAGQLKGVKQVMLQNRDSAQADSIEAIKLGTENQTAPVILPANIATQTISTPITITPMTLPTMTLPMSRGATTGTDQSIAFTSDRRIPVVSTAGDLSDVESGTLKQNLGSDEAFKDVSEIVLFDSTTGQTDNTFIVEEYGQKTLYVNRQLTQKLASRPVTLGTVRDEVGIIESTRTGAPSRVLMAEASGQTRSQVKVNVFNMPEATTARTRPVAVLAYRMPDAADKGKPITYERMEIDGGTVRIDTAQRRRSQIADLTRDLQKAEASGDL